MKHTLSLEPAEPSVTIWVELPVVIPVNVDAPASFKSIFAIKCGDVPVTPVLTIVYRLLKVAGAIPQNV